MSKTNRSNKIWIQNVWNVGFENQDFYTMRFKHEGSADGWATAMIPKSDKVRVESVTKRNMYNIYVDDENVNVRIRTKTADGYLEREVPIRGKADGELGFKELYALSRQLVNKDKAKHHTDDGRQQVHANDRQQTHANDREVPVVPNIRYDPFEDDDLPFQI